jgi:two-component system, LuxR family, sensor kinase FixL
MSYVTVIWSVIASGSLLLALMYGCVWIMDRKAYASLAFAFEALSIVLSVIVELGMMHASSPEEWGEWVRWNQIPVFLRTAALVAFVRIYFGTGRTWLMVATIGSRLIIAIASFVMDPNFNFTRIDSIDKTQFLGEQVTTIGSAVTSPYQWLATVSVCLVLVFVADASISLWRQGTRDARRKAIVIGGATFLSWAVGVTYTQIMVYQGARLPVLLSPPYLIMLAAMTFELSRDTLRASRLARELRASESSLDLAASAAGLGMWSWEAKSNRVWISSRMPALFGISAGEPFDAERALSMIEPGDADQVERVWRQAIASGGAAETQFRIRASDGSTRWLLARGRAETDAAGKLASVQGVLRDVTDQQRAREENEELRRELAHAGRVSILGTLSSSLTHELGQPLAAILLNAETGEMLLDKPHPDVKEIRNIFADIVRDDRRAAEVIDGLRKFLKRREIDFARVQVETLIQDVATLLRSDAVVRNVTLECTGEPGLPPIRGDRVHLSQVLINVLMNGMDAVADLPPERRHVRLNARSDGNGNIELTVQDSGSGVAPGVMSRIFEPFFTTKATGMGMGLSVSRTIVQAHGGRLSVENSPGGGAIFRVLLPILV